MALLKNHNPLQRGAVRRGKHGLAMPGRPIHANPTRTVILSGAKDPASACSAVGLNGSFEICFSVRGFIAPQNAPIVAQNLHILARSPQPRSRALPRSRMPNKEIANPVRPHDPAAMDFNGFLLREAMHDEEFVEGILKWISGIAALDEELLIHL